jgi:tetratricopeptide (TPR) repeat protein
MVMSMGNRTRSRSLTACLLGITLAAGWAAGCGAPPLPGRRSNNRVLLIGLDGADWDRIEPMMEQGRLPHIAALVRRGAVGQVAFERPPLSPILWTTLATSRPADEHRILDFVEADPDTGRAVPVTGRGRRVKALWNFADDAGLTSVVIGWWATWPAEQIRGAVISDRWSYTLLPLHPSLTVAATVSPVELEAGLERIRVPSESLGAAELMRFLPPDEEMRSVLDGSLPGAADGVEHPIAHLRRVVAVTRSVEAAALELMDSFWPDLTMVYFQGVDEVGHRFARYEPPALPSVSPRDRGRYGGVLDAFYRFQDEAVGRLVKAAGPETAVVLVSDHGFARGAERPAEEPADFTGKAALWHVGPGILVFAGGPFTRNRLGEARLADVAPTILAALGLPVAEDFSGRPVRAALSDSFLEAHPVASISSYERTGGRVRRLETTGAAGGLDADAQLSRLRALGYLGGAPGGRGVPLPTDKEGLTPSQRLNLATVLAEGGKTREARLSFETAIDADPASVLARRGLFDLLSGEGLWEEAVLAGEDLLAGEGRASAESYAAVARLWVEAGRLGRGRQFMESHAGDPEAAGPPLARGILAEGAGSAEAAEAEYREALRREPGSWEAAEAVFRLFESQGRLAEAVPLIRQGLAARGGDSPPHLIALGYMALQRNDLEAAGDYLTRAAEEAPNEPEVQLYLGSVHYRSGRHMAAVRAFSQVLEAEPEHREARANLVLALGKSGRIAQALEVFRRSGPSGRDDPRLLNAAAYACLVNGMAAEGLPLAERSLELAPGNPETRNLAEALHREATDKGPKGGE